MTYVETGMRPAESGSQVGSQPHHPSREQRLETLIRRILPRVNLLQVGSDVRQGLMREFSEIRNGGQHAEDVHFENGQCLFWFDCPVLVTAQSGGQEALLMRVPEDEAGAYYMMMIASPPIMEDLKADRICLRKACLHEKTHLYLTDECVEGPARVLHGPVHEYLLPEEGFYASEYFTSLKEELESPEV